MEEKTKKKLKSIAGWILYLGILAVLIFGVPRGLAVVLDTEYPIASITSGSMWPALKQGDFVFIKGIKDKADIQTGDIVVFKNEKGFTIHRVVELREKTLVTKGDANNTNDAPVAYSEVIGKTFNLGEGPLRIPFLGSVGLTFGKILGSNK